MRIDALYKKLADLFGETEIYSTTNRNPNYVVRPPLGYARIRVGDYGSGIDDMFERSRSDTFSSIVVISRHFVYKPLYTISSSSVSSDNKFTVTTTNDHTCAVYNENYDRMCELMRNAVKNTDDKVKKLNEIDDSDFVPSKIVSFKAASELKVGDRIPVRELPVEEVMPHDCPIGTEFDGERISTGDGEHRISYYDCDGVAVVDSVTVDQNTWGQWVYDIEVESGRHVYYANGVLVHNSQFMNLAPITKKYCKEAGLSSDTIFEELPQEVKDRVVKTAYDLQRRINENVEQLVNKTCHTSHGSDLHYALEYIAAEGFYFAKKCYIVRKILSDDLPCNKFKYSGISVKKAEIPASMKNFLKDIYESTMTKDDWNENNYRTAVENAYSEFIKMDWGDVAFYKKMRTAKASLNELGTESEKGAGAHARACNFYNGLIKELGIAGKYPNITLGDEMRYTYVIPTNVYGQDVIAFKGEFPEEFRKIFKIDYVRMFDKIFTSSLKRYVEIMNYTTVDPTKQVEDPSFDIF